MRTTASARRLKVLLAVLTLGGVVALAQRLPQPGWHHLGRSAEIAPGVTYRSFRLGWNQKADLIDVDQSTAPVRLQIVSEDTGIQSGEAGGGRETPAGWLLRRHALAAISGGYFGRDFPDERTAFVNLCQSVGSESQSHQCPAGADL